MLPQLPPGFIIHVHDIVLPWDYAPEWSRDWNWTEQYLLQALFDGGDNYEVIWPGYHLQRTLPDFDPHFPHSAGRDAYSLWLRKVI